MKPHRIQMTRRKGGWRHDHPNAVVVARPSGFGNPFTIKAAEAAGFTRRGCVAAFDDWLAGNPWACGADKYEAQRLAILCAIPSLRGRDLACWCPLDQPCHADVLLRLANE